MNSGIEFAQKINLAYNSVCKPLLHKFNLPQTAFDILMFLANNPEYTTARDIVEVRKLILFLSMLTGLCAMVISYEKKPKVTEGKHSSYAHLQQRK